LTNAWLDRSDKSKPIYQIYQHEHIMLKKSLIFVCLNLPGDPRVMLVSRYSSEILENYITAFLLVKFWIENSLTYSGSVPEIRTYFTFLYKVAEKTPTRFKKFAWTPRQKFKQQGGPSEFFASRALKFFSRLSVINAHLI
jgi:hypothetical protein